MQRALSFHLFMIHFIRMMNKSSQLTRHSKGSSSMRPEKFTQNDRVSERKLNLINVNNDLASSSLWNGFFYRHRLLFFHFFPSPGSKWPIKRAQIGGGEMSSAESGKWLKWMEKLFLSLLTPFMSIDERESQSRNKVGRFKLKYFTCT